jgi:hypothetical protein
LSFREQSCRQRSILIVYLCFEEQGTGSWIDNGTDACDLDLSWLMAQIQIEVDPLADGKLVCIAFRNGSAESQGMVANDRDQLLSSGDKATWSGHPLPHDASKWSDSFRLLQPLTSDAKLSCLDADGGHFLSDVIQRRSVTSLRHSLGRLRYFQIGGADRVGLRQLPQPLHRRFGFVPDGVRFAHWRCIFRA